MIVNENLCCLVGVHFTIGSEHHSGVSGLSQSVQFIRAWVFFAHHVHWCSWIDCELSLLWSFRSGCRHYPRFNWSIKRSFVRHIPRCAADASFLVESLFLWSCLGFWRARTTLMRFTLLDNSLRWTFLSRIFYFCQVSLENLTPCVDPNFLSSRRLDFLG